jgi:hypothetical protein
MPIEKRIENSEINNGDEQSDILDIKKFILQNINKQEFLEKISPTELGKITEETFNIALETLLNADLELPRYERIRLFKKTIEYYGKKSNLILPLWHSTSSYGLRKILRDGFSGGQGQYSGEAANLRPTGIFQKYISVSHPDHPEAESFQQVFARTSSKKKRIAEFFEN